MKRVVLCCRHCWHGMVDDQHWRVWRALVVVVSVGDVTSGVVWVNCCRVVAVALDSRESKTHLTSKEILSWIPQLFSIFVSRIPRKQPNSLPVHCIEWFGVPWTAEWMFLGIHRNRTAEVGFDVLVKYQSFPCWKFEQEVHQHKRYYGQQIVLSD